MPVIASQGSDEQGAYWLPICERHEIIGCYAQTELGHGSNVMYLETEATYIPETDEIDIHSPSLTSTKWWIGGLGVTATHAVVQAKLIVDGKSLGPHLFIVPIRSLDDHKPLPNVRVGDIGPKAYGGFAAFDNGWARFNHHRIPREYMLMRNSKLAKGGEYTKPAHDKLAYGSMVAIRATMISEAGRNLAMVATITARYTTVRRQFIDPSEMTDIFASGDPAKELQVISYPSVRYRLIPSIAKAYAFVFCGRHVEALYQDMMGKLLKGDTALLAEVHAVTSGLKAYCSKDSVDSQEECRKALGGHGYSAFAGVSQIFAEMVPSCTYEGDNYLLVQQRARATLKTLQKFSTASKMPNLSTIPYSNQFLICMADLEAFENAHPPNEVIDNPAVWDSPQVQIDVLSHCAARLFFELAQLFASGERPWKSLTWECHRASLAQSQLYVLQRFIETLDPANPLTRSAYGQQIASAVPIDPSIKPLLSKLRSLYGINLITSRLGDFMQDGYIQPQHVASLRERERQLTDELAEQAIGLTDAFHFDDFELESALGRNDGNAYEAMFQSALKEPLNQGMDGKAVVEGYEKYLRPLIHQSRGSKL